MTESKIIEVGASDWHAQNHFVARATVLAALESGKVLHFPNLPFLIRRDERVLLDPALAVPHTKNVSLAPDGGRLAGMAGDDRMHSAAHALMARFQVQAGTLIDGLFPTYRGKLRAAPTSLRLARVETRRTSWRKDDSRLHIDAFPSRPNHGERILRVFANVNPSDEARVWRVGEPFEDVARRFLPSIRPQFPGSAWLLEALSITKSRRSPYDHLMLGLHDAMKADLAYQRDCPQETHRFAPGSAWICFSDQTSHAVMSGQFMLEQTFFLPVRAMAQPDRAPLGIMERLTGRVLA